MSTSSAAPPHRAIAAALHADSAAAGAALNGFEDDFFRVYPALRGRFRYPDQLAPAAVLVPIVERSDGPTVLLTYRAADLPTYPGEIVFPGGGHQAGDGSLADTALREAEEEIGLAHRFVEIAGYLDARPMGRAHRVQPVVGFVAPAADFSCCPREVAALFEIPLAVALDSGRYRREPVVFRDSARVEVRVLEHAGHRIVGATADILWDLCRKNAGAHRHQNLNTPLV